MRILFKAFIKILEELGYDDKTRGDMYLPKWLLVFGVVLMSVGTVGLIVSIFMLIYILMLISAGTIILGVLAVLCWNNQKICVLSEYEFEYTTFLGNKRRYLFSAIQGIKQNSDSMTMYVGGEKVHIESCAILSERLVELINNQLEKIENEMQQ